MKKEDLPLIITKNPEFMQYFEGLEQNEKDCEKHTIQNLKYAGIVFFSFFTLSIFLNKEILLFLIFPISLLFIFIELLIVLIINDILHDKKNSKLTQQFISEINDNPQLTQDLSELVIDNKTEKFFINMLNGIRNNNNNKEIKNNFSSLIAKNIENKKNENIKKEFKIDFKNYQSKEKNKREMYL